MKVIFYFSDLLRSCENLRSSELYLGQFMASIILFLGMFLQQGCRREHILNEETSGFGSLFQYGCVCRLLPRLLRELKVGCNFYRRG